MCIILWDMVFCKRLYENAMMTELRKSGLNVQRKVLIKVFYEEQLVGEYFADIIVEENIIVELKAAENLCNAHEFQLINYLKATELEIGLLLNFGKKPQFRRKIFTN